jgi:Holliday junction resolvase RusA-like endonuclease
MKIELPIPPPENERLIFARNIGPRGQFVLSTKYREYKKHAQWILLKLKAQDNIVMLDPTFENQLILEISVYLPDKRRDAHGCLKPLLDVMQGVIYKCDKWVVPRFNKFEIDPAHPRVEVVY